MKMMRTCAWLRLALYSSNQKYKKTQESFFLGGWGWGAGRARPALSKLKTLTCTSPLYCTFELLYPCTQQPGKCPHCAETDLQAVKLASKQKPFDLYRPATGLSRVAENTNNLQICFTNVTELSQHKAQNTVLFSCFCSVSLVWTRPQ
jgi:hypothetical protein